MFDFLRKDKSLETKQITQFHAIVNGSVIDITSVNDLTFANKIMGDAIAFIPDDNVVIAPCDCTVIVARTNMKHALDLRLENGIEILIHVSIDTVTLDGNSFTQLVKQGDNVKAGSMILKFESNFIKENK